MSRRYLACLTEGIYHGTSLWLDAPLAGHIIVWVGKVPRLGTLPGHWARYALDWRRYAEEDDRPGHLAPYVFDDVVLVVGPEGTPSGPADYVRPVGPPTAIGRKRP